MKVPHLPLVPYNVVLYVATQTGGHIVDFVVRTHDLSGTGIHTRFKLWQVRFHHVQHRDLSIGIVAVGFLGIRIQMFARGRGGQILTGLRVPLHPLDKVVGIPARQPWILTDRFLVSPPSTVTNDIDGGAVQSKSSTPCDNGIRFSHGIVDGSHFVGHDIAHCLDQGQIAGGRHSCDLRKQRGIVKPSHRAVANAVQSFGVIIVFRDTQSGNPGHDAMVRRGEGIGGKLGNFFGQREKRDQVFRSGGWRQLGIAKGMRCGAAVHVRGLLGDGGGGEQVQEEKKEEHRVFCWATTASGTNALGELVWVNNCSSSNRRWLSGDKGA